MSEFTHKAFRGSILFLAFIWLGGCASVSGVSDFPQSKSSTGVVLSKDELNRFFESAASGTSFQADASPWGKEVEIIVATAYDAASGRQCRDISIRDHSTETVDGIVCRIQPGLWESIRPITRSQDMLGNRL